MAKKHHHRKHAAAPRNLVGLAKQIRPHVSVVKKSGKRAFSDKHGKVAVGPYSWDKLIMHRPNAPKPGSGGGGLTAYYAGLGPVTTKRRGPTLV